jgi:hypothetical protein
MNVRNDQSDGKGVEIKKWQKNEKGNHENEWMNIKVKIRKRNNEEMELKWKIENISNK